MDEVYVPVLHFFENGNSFTGSWKELRFLLPPSEEEISAQIWRGPYCMEKSTIEQTRSFPLTQEGRTEMTEWLNSLREVYGVRSGN